MDIKKIAVKGLFHTFNHEIIFSSGTIRIIIGENGVGKTAMLKILDAVFNKEYQILYSIVFDSVIIEFTADKWTITKETKDNKNYIRIISSAHKNDDQIIQVKTKNDFSHSISQKYKNNEWIEKAYDSLLSKEVWTDYLDLFDKSSKSQKEWYELGLSNNQIKLINAQRLFKQKESEDNPNYQETVSFFSKSLVDILTRDDANFSVISQKLDRTFANRLLKNLNKKTRSKININEILKKLNNLSAYRSLLSRVGIIAQEQDEVIQNLKDGVDANILTVLQLYVDDNTEKLECYRDTAKKLQILLDIVNRRFKHKKIVVDKSKGFLVKSTLLQEMEDEEGIAVNKLSSGEQNELVMFYDLLFNCDSKHLVLIDEPEISLHLKWQQSLIEDLLSICNNNNLSLLIATHSPDIIGDNWNLVQTLSGEE